jgi:hypothetical protein
MAMPAWLTVASESTTPKTERGTTLLTATYRNKRVERSDVLLSICQEEAAPKVIEQNIYFMIL